MSNKQEIGFVQLGASFVNLNRIEYFTLIGNDLYIYLENREKPIWVHDPKKEHTPTLANALRSKGLSKFSLSALTENI